MANEYTTIEQTKDGLRAAKEYADGLGYDDTALSDRVTTLETASGGHTLGKDVPSDAVFTDTVYDDTAIIGRVEALEAGGYDDTVLSGRVTAVEGLLGGHSVGENVPADAVFTDTVYDDTALSGRVSTVEGLLGGHSVAKNVPADAVFTDTVYDDTALASRVADLEAGGYDDTALSNRVSATESAINTLNGSGAGSVSKTVSDAIDAVVDGAPATFDTFKEIADWIQDDQTGAAAMAADLANKVNKIAGKGLSTEDYTTAEKQKLAGLSNYDDTALSGRVSTLENAGYVTEADIESAIGGKADSADLAAVATSGSYNDLTNKPTIPAAYDDTALAGRVSTLENAGYVTDADISTMIDGKANTADLAAVATSGSYNDLSDKPTIPTLPTLATVATTGNYNDLENKPTIPTAYDDTALAGRVSALENAGYATSSDIDTAIADKVDASDLAAVATSGSYNDLTDKPAAASGGAIPAYIVGNTMTKGWLSTTDGGTALTPVDKQEYVILSSGDWLRKHVMWFEDLNVYRLTGKVGIVSEIERSITQNEGTDTVSLSKTLYVGGHSETLFGSVTAKENGSIQISASTNREQGKRLYIRVGTENRVTIGFNTTSGAYTYSGTINISDADIGKEVGVYVSYGIQDGAGISPYGNVTVTGSMTQDYAETYADYETDDVIDITEAEVDQLWGETGGMPNPNNNVFSTEERLWGYWIDGKPIYRKVVTGSITGDSTELLSGVDKILDAIGMVNASNNAYGILPGYVFLTGTASNDQMLAISLNKSTQKVVIVRKNTSTFPDGATFEIALCYTKTT